MGVMGVLSFISLFVGVTGAFINIGTEVGEWFAAMALTGAVLLLGIRYWSFGKTDKDG